MSTVRSDFRITTAWRLFATVSSIITALLSYRLYNQYLGKSLFVLIITAINIIALLPQFDGGYRMVINRRLLADGPGPTRRHLVDFAQALYSWGAVAAGLIGIGLMCLYRLRAGSQVAALPLLFYLSLGAMGFMFILCTAQTQLLIGLGRQRQMFILNAVSAWLYLGLLWTLLKGGQMVWAFPIAQFSFLAVPTGLSWWLAREDLPGVRLLDFRWTPACGQLFAELWVVAAPAFLCQLVMLVLYAADGILAQQLLGTGASDVVYAASLFTNLRRSLQSADEAIWPRLAAGAAGAVRTSASLVRINGVLYGVVMTVAAVTLPPFLGWWTDNLRPNPWVIWLFAGRYLITGLASQPAYYLYGHGKFGEIARHLGLEFGVAVILSFVFAPRFGAAGVAGAFTLATLVGVAVPLPWAYTESAELRPAHHFTAVWTRAGAAILVAGTLSLWLLRFASGWLSTLLVGGTAAILSLGVFAVWAAWRAGRHGKIDVRSLASHF